VALAAALCAVAAVQTGLRRRAAALAATLEGDGP
jgi:hypothetical protein